MKAKDFIKEFSSAVDWAYVPSEEIYASLNNLLSSLRNSELVPKSRRTDLIFYHANKKFKFNADGVRSFLSFAANHGITFNYHEKNVINRAFDEDNKSLLLEMLNCHKTSSNNDELVDLLMSVYSPIHKNATLQQLHSELRNPTLTRKDSKPKDRSYEILTSLFSAYVYTSFPEKYMHEVNDPIERKHNYYSDYWEHLHSNHPDLFSRDNALCGLHITKDDQIECGGYNQLSSKVLEFVRSTYANLTNHGFMAILIDTIDDRNVSSQWKLFSDIICIARST